MIRLSQAIRRSFVQTMTSSPKFLIENNSTDADLRTSSCQPADTQKNVGGVKTPFSYMQEINSVNSMKIDILTGFPICVGTVGSIPNYIISEERKLEIETGVNGLAVAYPTPPKDRKLVCLIGYDNEDHPLRKIHMCETLEDINQLMMFHKATKASHIAFYFVMGANFPETNSTDKINSPAEQSIEPIGKPKKVNKKTKPTKTATSSTSHFKTGSADKANSPTEQSIEPIGTPQKANKKTKLIKTVTHSVLFFKAGSTDKTDPSIEQLINSSSNEPKQVFL